MIAKIGATIHACPRTSTSTLDVGHDNAGLLTDSGLLDTGTAAFGRGSRPA
jgi:hypothetical protein